MISKPIILNPKRLFVEIPGRCERSCVHCPVDPDDQPLDLKAYKELFQSAAEIGFSAVTFCGSNLFGHDDAADLLSAANHAGLQVRAHGWIRPTEAASMVELGRSMTRLEITVPLWGNRDTHDRATNTPGSFDRDLGVLQSLCQADAPVSALANIVLTDANASELDSLRERLDYLGIKHRTATWWFLLRHPRTMDILSPEHRNRLLTETATRDGERTRYADDSPCGASINKVFVDREFGVRACAAARKPVANLRVNCTLTDVWYDDQIWGAWRTLTIADLPGCLDCSLQSSCHICPAAVIDGALRMQCTQ